MTGIRFILLTLFCVFHAFTVVGGEPLLRLRGGFPIYAFSGVETNDARVSTSWYLKKLTDGARMDYTSQIYPGRDSLLAAMAEGKLDFVLLTTPDMLLPEVSAAYDPILMPVRGDTAREKFYLLVHRDSAIRSLADLKGKGLLMFSGSDSQLEFAWMNREFRAAGLPEARDMFKSIEYPQGAAKTVLPVFFKKADVCLIAGSVLKMVSKLNPQVEQRLVAVASSEMLLTTVLCINKSFPAEGRRRLTQIAKDLHNTADGRQILMLTKIDRIDLFKDEDLASCRALLNGEPSPQPAGEGPTLAADAAP